jgi:hypothetical protein
MAIAIVLAAVYAMTWLGFWGMEIPGVLAYLRGRSDEDLPDVPFARVMVFLMLAATEGMVAFFWPFLIAKGDLFVWSALPWVEDDDDEEKDNKDAPKGGPS